MQNRGSQVFCSLQFKHGTSTIEAMSFNVSCLRCGCGFGTNGIGLGLGVWCLSSMHASPGLPNSRVWFILIAEGISPIFPLFLCVMFLDAYKVLKFETCMHATNTSKGLPRHLQNHAKRRKITRNPHLTGWYAFLVYTLLLSKDSPLTLSYP
jgi:hypothetical protein